MCALGRWGRRVEGAEGVDGRVGDVEDPEGVDVEAFFDEHGAVAAESLLKVEFCAGRPAVQEPMCGVL